MKFAVLLLAVVSVEFADVCSGEEAEEEWTRVLLTEAAKQGAVCLDGTPAGYYFRPGYGSGADKWHLHLKGGATCNYGNIRAQRCIGFIENGKGSSRLWPPYLPNSNATHEIRHWKMDGILSSNRSINPDFYNWNTAYIIPCDTTEFTSNLEEPVEVPETTEKNAKTRLLYFRGQKILQANLDNILERGMKDASEVIFGGGSSGAQSVYLMADSVGELLPSHVRYSAIADAGFLFDKPTVDGEWYARAHCITATNTQNRTGSFDRDCVDAYSEEDAWMCHLAPSTYDTNCESILLIHCIDCTQSAHCLDDCSEKEMGAIQEYHESLVEWVIENPWESTTDGMFVDSCLVHTQTLQDSSWTSTSVNGQTIQETVGIWYFGREGNTKVMEECDFPCNPTCTPDMPQPDPSMNDQNTPPESN